MPEKATPESAMRGEYQRRILAIRDAFEASQSGAATIAARAQAMDEFIAALWAKATAKTAALRWGLRWLRWAGMAAASYFPTRMLT